MFDFQPGIHTVLVELMSVSNTDIHGHDSPKKVWRVDLISSMNILFGATCHDHGTCLVSEREK